MGLRGEIAKVVEQVATHPRVIRVVRSERFISGLARALEVPAEAVARVRSIAERVAAIAIPGRGRPGGE